MKNKKKLIVALGCMALACAGFAACAPKSVIEKNQEKGYKITVTYDENGGTFLNRPGVKIIDQFNPDKMNKDGNGAVTIKLVEPTKRKLTDSDGSSITLSKAGSFFAGWYQNREVVCNESGNPVDKNGKELVAKGDGTYQYADSNLAGVPAYTYSGHWDFQEDTIVYTEDAYAETDGLCNITLYAAWVDYYEFNYYYKMSNDMEADWKQVTTTEGKPATTTFNYASVAETGVNTNTMWTPNWQGAKVEYSHKYSNNTTYQFPRVAGTTFLSAYTDAECVNEIGNASQTEQGSFTHPGTMVLDDGETEALKVENTVQNIYMILDEGEQYRISKPEDLNKNPNTAGYYEICANLDFKDVAWPVALSTNLFTGKMYGKDGNTYTISNVNVKYSSKNAFGCLFGGIEKGAEVKNLTFANVTFDMVSSLDVKDGCFGLFAGYIFNGAVIENVTVGGMMRLGEVKAGANAKFNILANGILTGLTKTELSLQVYGVEYDSGDQAYMYTINPSSVKWNAKTDVITFESATVDNRYSAQAYVNVISNNE